MKIHLITDTHFNHKDKMTKYCGRPEDYENIIMNSLSSISKDDILIHLGDICIGNDLAVHEQYIQPLQCRKILVRGNHDGKSSHWYLEHGWDFVCRTFTDKIEGKTILFSHIPQPSGDWDLNIHGHFHNSDHRRHEPELQKIYTEKHRLLAIEYTGCKSILLTNLINNYEKYCY